MRYSRIKKRTVSILPPGRLVEWCFTSVVYFGHVQVLPHQKTDGVDVADRSGFVEGCFSISVPSIDAPSSSGLRRQETDKFTLSVGCGPMEGSVASIGPCFEFLHKKTDGVGSASLCDPMNGGFSIVVFDADIRTEL